MVEMSHSSVRNRGAAVAQMMSFILLLGVGVEKIVMRMPAQDPTPYHAHVQEQSLEVPAVIGDWVGVDCPISTATISILKPNVLISRQYVNVRTGQNASVLLVQCADRRDLIGHYPPVCYPGQGWSVTSDKHVNIQVKNSLIPMLEYKMVKPGSNNDERMVVSNFMIVPNGRFVRDMKGLREGSSYKIQNLFGAAQMQVVVPVYLTANVREQIYRELVTGYWPLIQSIQLRDIRK